MKSKISPGEILATVPPSDGNFKAALKAASPEDLKAAIQIRHEEGHKGALKALADEVARRAVAEHSQAKGREQLAPEAPLEVIGASEDTGRMDAALKAFAKKAKLEDLQKGFRLHREQAGTQSRETMLSVIRAGLYLRTIKIKLKHGKFMEFLETEAKTETGDKPVNTLRCYLGMATRFIAAVSWPSKVEGLENQRKTLTKEQEAALLSYDIDSPAGASALAHMLKPYRNPFQLETDFREARKLAEKEAEKDAREKAKAAPKEGDEDEGDQPPASPGDNSQMNFFAELFAAPIAQIKTVYEAHCGSMTDDDILATESALQTTLEVVQLRADDVRKRQKEAQRQADVAKRKLLSGAP